MGCLLSFPEIKLTKKLFRSGNYFPGPDVILSEGTLSAPEGGKK